MTPEQVRDECERLLSLYGDGFVLRVPRTGERLTSAMVREELAKANEEIARRAVLSCQRWATWSEQVGNRRPRADHSSA